jgi:hypothetical protein
MKNLWGIYIKLCMLLSNKGTFERGEIVRHICKKTTTPGKLYNKVFKGDWMECGQIGHNFIRLLRKSIPNWEMDPQFED